MGNVDSLSEGGPAAADCIECCRIHFDFSPLQPVLVLTSHRDNWRDSSPQSWPSRELCSAAVEQLCTEQHSESVWDPCQYNSSRAPFPPLSRQYVTHLVDHGIPGDSSGGDGPRGSRDGVAQDEAANRLTSSQSVLYLPPHSRSGGSTALFESSLGLPGVRPRAPRYVGPWQERCLHADTESAPCFHLSLVSSPPLRQEPVPSDAKKAGVGSARVPARTRPHFSRPPAATAGLDVPPWACWPSRYRASSAAAAHQAPARRTRLPACFRQGPVSGPGSPPASAGGRGPSASCSRAGPSYRTRPRPRGNWPAR